MLSRGVALCLNSSMLGFYAHAGFLSELRSLNVHPEAVSGSSAGALVAGLYAAGVNLEEMSAFFMTRAFHLVFREFGAPARAMGMLFNRPGHTGMLRGTLALSLLRKRVSDRRVEDCTAPRLAIAVTNLTVGRAEVLAHGPLAELILASGAFPCLFAARKIDNALYWDGGIANPLPFETHLADPAIHTIIVHLIENPGEVALRNAARPLRISDAFTLSHQVICDEMLRLKSDLAKRVGKRLIVLRTLAPRPGMWTARRSGPACLECGRQTVRDHADVLRQLAT